MPHSSHHSASTLFGFPSTIATLNRTTSRGFGRRRALPGSTGSSTSAARLVSLLSSICMRHPEGVSSCPHA